MSRHTRTTRFLWRHVIGLLLFAPVLIGAGEVTADEPILVNGVPGDGFVMLVGDPKNWDTPVGEEPTSTAAGYLSVEPDTELGAVRLAWTGGARAQFFVASQPPRDYSGYLEQDSALVLVMRVDQKPDRKAMIRMGCGYPCGSDADITALLQALPLDQWLRLSIDLRCFARGGLDVENVDVPFLITTAGEMALAIAGIEIVPAAGPKATIHCTD